MKKRMVLFAALILAMTAAFPASAAEVAVTSIGQSSDAMMTVSYTHLQRPSDDDNHAWLDSGRDRDRARDLRQPAPRGTSGSGPQSETAGNGNNGTQKGG